MEIEILDTKILKIMFLNKNFFSHYLDFYILKKIVKALQQGVGLTAPHLVLQVNYDDANHAEVDAAISTLKSIVEKYWDENLFKLEFKKTIMNEWVRNENNLQDEFESLDEYLENYGVEMSCEKSEKCTICNDSGEIHYGGSFGGPVHTVPCNCKNN